MPNEPGDTPPAPKTIDKPKPVTPATEATKPCCCSSMRLYLDEVCVTERTSGGFPGIGKLFADHVFLTCWIECQKNAEPVSWPSAGSGGIEIDAGECKQPHILLTKTPLTPNDDCRLVCNIRIAVFKKSPSDKILDAMTKVLADIAKLAAELNALKKLLPAGQSSSPDMDHIQSQIDDLFKEAGALWKALTGVGDELMDEFGINFNGLFRCDDAMIAAFEDTPEAMADPYDKHIARIERVVRGHSGRWTLKFSAIKTCPEK